MEFNICEDRVANSNAHREQTGNIKCMVAGGVDVEGQEWWGKAELETTWPI